MNYRALLVVGVMSLVLTGIVLGAPFSETGNVDNGQPSSLTQDVRVEIPYNTNATAIQKKATATTYVLTVNVSNSTPKTYIIAKERISVYDNTNAVVLFVNGKQYEFSTLNVLNKTWIKITGVQGTSPTFRFVAAGLAGQKTSIIERLRLLFLDNPIISLLGGTLVLLVVFSGIVWVREQARIQWK